MNWDHDLSRVRMMPMAGYPLKKDATPEELSERIVSIRDQVLAFCKEVQARRIMIEAYGFAISQKISMLAELGGSVKIDLWENWGVHPQPINASRARKILLQQLPKADSKLFTQINVRRLEGPALTWNDDEIDAFVIANACLMDAGGTAVTFMGAWPEDGPPTKKKQKPRPIV